MRISDICKCGDRDCPEIGKKLESQPTVALEELQKLDCYYLLVNDRRPIENSPRRFDYVETFQILCGPKMKRADITFTIKILNRMTYKGTNPQLSVRKKYHRHHAVQAEEGFVDQLVASYKQLEPIIEFMRGA